jgi:hypothetical protein
LVGPNEAMFRNNIIRAGACPTGANVYEDEPSTRPLLLDSNAFEQVSPARSLYRGITLTDPRTAAEVNALNDVVARDNFSASCPLPLDSSSACVDAGTPTDAPSDDYDGEPRSTLFPDVGPDEWGDLLRPCDAESESCGVFTELSATDGHVCGLQTNGLIRCWGLLELGGGDVPPISFRAMSVGVHHGCGIRRDDGGLECWGDNSVGQASPPAGTFRSVGSGPFHSCAVREDGALLCWGVDAFGMPLAAPSGAFRSVGPSVGVQTCAVDAVAHVRCFGPISPNLSAGATGGYQSVGAGRTMGCGRTIPGGVHCLHYDPRLPFIPWSPGGPNRALSVGDEVACVIRSDDTLECWSEDPAAALTPPQGTFKSVSVGNRFACAIRTDDAVVCWGDNTWGQLDVP